MTINDPELARIIKNKLPIDINGKQFIVESSKRGKCDGCYFQNQLTCPVKAVTYCTSNGGNILKIKQ